MLRRKAHSKSQRNAGFTLIELIVAVTILAIIAGAAIPVTAKAVAYKARKATASEQVAIIASVEAYFADTGVLPSSVADLLVSPGGVAGWTGPYLPGISTDTLSGLTTYQVDGWSRPYRVTVAGDTWTLESMGEDGAFGTSADIQVILTVTHLRRDVTIERMKTVNQAITQYNGAWLSTDPLSTDWPTAFGQLVARGYLPNDASLQVDGWAMNFDEDPAGASPVVRIDSTNL